MGRIAAAVTNARREEIWGLLLKGREPQSIKRELNLTNPTLYRDIAYLQKQSRRYIFDLARGTHVLMYKKAIDGTNLALKEAWNKFLDPSILEKQKLGYLRLIGEFNKSLMELTINGPSVMAIEQLKRKIENASINIDSFNLNDNDINDNSNGYNDTTDKYDSAHGTIN